MFAPHWHAAFTVPRLACAARFAKAELEAIVEEFLGKVEAVRTRFLWLKGTSSEFLISKMKIEPDNLVAVLTERSRQLLELFVCKDFEAMTEAYVEVLEHFDATHYIEITSEVRLAVGMFLKSFFCVLCDESYLLPKERVHRLIQLNPIVSMLTALSPFETTDAFLALLLKQKNNFVKLLLLVNARNRTPLRIETLVGINPHLGSMWYGVYFFSTYSRSIRLIHENALRHVRTVPGNLKYISGLSLEAAFAASYIDEINDRPLKERLNRNIQEQLASIKIVNQPNRRKIAIVSQCWVPTSSVYKILRHFVHALKPRYHLTLLELGEKVESVDRSIFDQVLNLSGMDGSLDVHAIVKNDFQLAFFPDVGMSDASMILSNLRICPIQCVSYGHSVSTWGSKIDYWIGGREAEPEPDPGANYSERLILLPGTGGPPVIPEYSLRYPARRTDRIVINCPWGAYKLNAEIMEDILAIRSQAKAEGHQLLFRFFPGSASKRHNNFLLLKHDLNQIFGNSLEVEVVPDRNYHDYMSTMEEGHLMLDSYPFGGCNSIMDALWLRQPLVTRYGSEWNNRYGMALLRRFGLMELAVSSREDYRNLAVRMIADTGYRESLADKIAKLDLVGGSWDKTDVDAFRRAIDYLIENHGRLSRDNERTPIRID